MDKNKAKHQRRQKNIFFSTVFFKFALIVIGPHKLQYLFESIKDLFSFKGELNFFMLIVLFCSETHFQTQYLEKLLIFNCYVKYNLKNVESMNLP